MISSLQALFMTAAVISLQVTVVLFLVFRRESDRSAQLWIKGSLLMAAGMVLLALRAVMPDWVAFGVTNSIMLLAIVLYGYSFASLYRPDETISPLSIALCLCYGLTQWALSAVDLGSYLALVAAAAWTAAHGWIWFNMVRLRKEHRGARGVFFFALLAALGSLVWGIRIYLTAAFSITLATDHININFLSLLAAHIILLAQQISYLYARLSDEKDKKREIARLNYSIEKLLQERQALIDELESKVLHRTQELALANEALSRLARTDALTGLPNRLMCDERLSHEFKQMKRTGIPFSVLLLDLDFFKKVNDTYGHESGDRVLERIALVLSGSIRETDLAARFGGEEFVLLLPRTSMEAALLVAEKIRKAVEGAPDPVAGKITVSIGVSEASLEDRGEDEVIRRADEGLYDAKREGRNRVCWQRRQAL